MKRGEKQSPELKARMRAGMMAHIAQKKCEHEWTIKVPILGYRQYYNLQCSRCRRMKKVTGFFKRAGRRGKVVERYAQPE